MPAYYITHPGTENVVFETNVRRTHIRPEAVRLTRELLARFGRFRVPRVLWDCCSRYACWLETTIVNEWADLMRRYEGHDQDGVWASAFALGGRAQRHDPDPQLGGLTGQIRRSRPLLLD